MIRDLTNEELAEALKEVVWKCGWDAIIKEVERRLQKLTKLEHAPFKDAHERIIRLEEKDSEKESHG
jgi:hypothetical protein